MTAEEPASPSLTLAVALGAVSALTAMAIDICIPSQPDIAVHYGLTPAAGAQLVSGYFWGYAGGQLLWGPISDRLGRLPALYMALAGFILAAIACALAPSFTALVAARFVQGVCGAASPVVVRAIARDQGGGSVTANLLASTTMIVGLAPLLAPSIGAGLAYLFDWRANFWFLMLFGLVLAATVKFVLEPRLPPHARSDRGESGLSYWRRVAPILLSKEFLTGAVAAALVGVGYFTFLSVGSAATREQFGVAPEAFAVLFALPAAFLLGGAFLARQLAGRLSLDLILMIACSLAGAGGAGLLTSSALAIPQWLFWSCASLYIAGFGMVQPIASTKALEPAGQAAGVAASFFGLITLLSGALAAQFAGSGLWGASAYRTLCLQLGLGAVLCFLFQLVVLLTGGGRRA